MSTSTLELNAATEAGSGPAQPEGKRLAIRAPLCRVCRRVAENAETTPEPLPEDQSDHSMPALTWPAGLSATDIFVPLLTLVEIWGDVEELIPPPLLALARSGIDRIEITEDEGADSFLLCDDAIEIGLGALQQQDSDGSDLLFSLAGALSEALIYRLVHLAGTGSPESWPEYDEPNLDSWTHAFLSRLSEAAVVAMGLGYEYSQHSHLCEVLQACDPKPWSIGFEIGRAMYGILQRCGYEMDVLTHSEGEGPIHEGE